MRNFNNKNNKIALITTVGNISLYKRTVSFFPENIKLFAIDGTDGLFGLNSIKFMFKKLKNHKIKWLILADEDVIFINSSIVFDIISNLEEEKIDVCGIRDGGMLSWRDKNPYLPNPFFCIINLENIFPIYSEIEFINNQYILTDEFNDDLSDLIYPYNKDSLFEGYYCFFLWLRRKKMRFKFLKAKAAGFENDYATTEVYGFKNEVFLYHTWYARTYGKNEYHTKRIEKVIDKGFELKGIEKRNIVWLKNYSFSFEKKLRKLKNKIFNLFK
ncbi:MAG: hypothetical protein WAV86_00760 [Lutibacter sp.]